MLDSSSSQERQMTLCLIITLQNLTTLNFNKVLLKGIAQELRPFDRFCSYIKNRRHLNEVKEFCIPL
jgi:hypothetical protein